MMPIRNKCHSCQELPLETSRYCLQCWIRDCVRKNLGIKDKETKEHYTGVLLVKLKKQNHLCVYTAKNLIAGVNLSLDHILPVVQFPELKTDVENLVWVDLSVNVAKHKLLPTQFRQMCEDVIYYKSEILK
jgi:hypothetical protein